jgi:hypothetical protein
MSNQIKKPSVSLAEAMRILNSGARQFSVNEVSVILESLSKIAEIDYSNFLRQYGAN